MPTAIYWGPELRLFYNDAWAPIPAERHPAALGKPGAEVWPEIWDVVGPQFAQVIATGKGFATYDQRLDMARGGVPRETYWNYSFTPIRDEHGRVCGILNQGNETTATVFSQRERRAEVERQRRRAAAAEERRERREGDGRTAPELPGRRPRRDAARRRRRRRRRRGIDRPAGGGLELGGGPLEERRRERGR